MKIIDMLETNKVMHLPTQIIYWKNNVGEVRKRDATYADIICDDVGELALLECDVDDADFRVI